MIYPQKSPAYLPWEEFWGCWRKTAQQVGGPERYFESGPGQKKGDKQKTSP